MKWTRASEKKASMTTTVHIKDQHNMARLGNFYIEENKWFLHINKTGLYDAFDVSEENLHLYQWLDEGDESSVWPGELTESQKLTFSQIVTKIEGIGELDLAKWLRQWLQSRTAVKAEVEEISVQKAWDIASVLSDYKHGFIKTEEAIKKIVDQFKQSQPTAGGVKEEGFKVGDWIVDKKNGLRAKILELFKDSAVVKYYTGETPHILFEDMKPSPPLLNPESQPSPSNDGGVKEEVYDLITHLHRQRKFSKQTFGPGDRLLGVLDHIRRELKEIEANPEDITEWIDLILLAFDGTWRRGFSPEEIAKALEAKQSKNEKRDWPDWRTAPKDKAIEHIKSQPSPSNDGGVKEEREMTDYERALREKYGEWTGKAKLASNPSIKRPTEEEMKKGADKICSSQEYASDYSVFIRTINWLLSIQPDK